MATLTSVNKEHLDNILDGIKKVEWRKKPLPLGKHYGYETKNKGGCGKVTGEFEVVDTIKFNLHGDTYRPQWLAQGCVSFEFLIKYANGADYLYANVIKNAKRYDKPKELGEFYQACKDVKDFPNGCRRKSCEHYYEEFQNCYVECCFNGTKPLERPPQSWCYVEELQNG